mmetsp:Transcript_20785/g.23178  ORF Transcript_20785/g.23178 Transcript_20785/m.23178 type:complete len:83 (+) Transcript_20785:1475-1723(+)
MVYPSPAILGNLILREDVDEVPHIRDRRVYPTVICNTKDKAAWFRLRLIVVLSKKMHRESKVNNSNTWKICRISFKIIVLAI